MELENKVLSGLADKLGSGCPDDTVEGYTQMSMRLRKLTELLTNGPSQEQLARLQGGLALALSSSLNIETGKLELLAPLFDRVLASPADKLLSAPLWRSKLTTDWTIGELCQDGWTRHGTMEPTIEQLVKGADKIQLEWGGTPFSSRKEPGLHFDRAYTVSAGEIWERSYSEANRLYEAGYEKLLTRIRKAAPDLLPMLEGNPIRRGEAQVLRDCCEKDLNGALSLVESFCPGFGARLFDIP